MEKGRKNKKNLYDYIAPAYNLFFPYQLKSFKTILSRADRYIQIPPDGKVLDVGCGTGALALCLHERGYRVTGVDASHRMIDMAKRNNRASMINFLVADALKGLPFKDKSFDLVISSYVAHGLDKVSRQIFFKEARRLARTQLIFQDYNKKRKPLSDIVEWLEGGNYFDFIQDAEEEMQGIFSAIEMHSFAAQVAWYICKP